MKCDVDKRLFNMHIMYFPYNIKYVYDIIYINILVYILIRRKLLIRRKYQIVLMTFFY